MRVADLRPSIVVDTRSRKIHSWTQSILTLTAEVLNLERESKNYCLDRGDGRSCVGRGLPISRTADVLLRFSNHVSLALSARKQFALCCRRRREAGDIEAVLRGSAILRKISI